MGILVNHKLQLNMQTSELLKDNDFAKESMIKKLVNYEMASKRHDYENMLEAREDYLKSLNDPELVRMKFNLSKTNTIANLTRRQKEKKIQRIYDVQEGTKF